MRTILMACLAGALVVSAAACSHGPSGEELAARSGPTIFNARTNPDTMRLHENLMPDGPHEVLAEIKDFQAPVTDAKFQLKAPAVEFPMRNVGGTTWVAEIPANELERLAVSGETMQYEGRVVARDANGEMSLEDAPLTIKIEAPAVKTS